MPCLSPQGDLLRLGHHHRVKDGLWMPFPGYVDIDPTTGSVSIGKI